MFLLFLCSIYWIACSAELVRSVDLKNNRVNANHSLHNTIALDNTYRLSNYYGTAIYNGTRNLFVCPNRLIKHHFRKTRSVIPIFIINKDRLRFLKQLMASYDRIKKVSNIEIVIVDNGSTYPPMIEYLAELETNGVVIYRWQERWNQEALLLGADLETYETWGSSWRDFYMLQEPVRYAVRTYRELHPEMEYYVVTDSDIDLSKTPADILVYYEGILRACPQLDKIGPHISFTDLSYDYQFFDSVTRTYQILYLQQVPSAAYFNNLAYHVSFTGIDTHWSMRRASQVFERLKGTSIRTYAPYQCWHLDFYDTLEYPDTSYYKSHDSNKLNHYTVTNKSETPPAYWNEAEAKYAKFYFDERHATSKLGHAP